MRQSFVIQILVFSLSVIYVFNFSAAIMIRFTVVALLSRAVCSLRFLCLHGGGGNGNHLRVELQAVVSALGSGHSFVYANAPTQQDGGNVWMRDPPGGKEVATTDRNWASASFTYLDGLVSSQGPFDALMGYSQGGAMTVLYLSQTPAPFRFAVVFCGYVPTTHSGLVARIAEASPMPTPTLFYMGTNDVIISNGMTREAVTHFSSATIVSDGGGHEPPTSGPALTQVVSYINGFVGGSNPNPIPTQSPPPRPSPPPTSQPPSPPLIPTAAVITTDIVVSGAVSDFTLAVRTELKSKVAAEAGVTPAAVSLDVTAASVRLSFTIAFESTASATTGASALSIALASPATASAFLTTTSYTASVVSVASLPALISPPPPSPSPTPPPSPPEATETGCDGGCVGAIVGGSCVPVLMLILWMGGAFAPKCPSPLAKKGEVKTSPGALAGATSAA